MLRTYVPFGARHLKIVEDAQTQALDQSQVCLTNLNQVADCIMSDGKEGEAAPAAPDPVSEAPSAVPHPPSRKFSGPIRIRRTRKDEIIITMFGCFPIQRRKK